MAALAATCTPGTFHGRLHSVLRLALQAVGPGPGVGADSAAVAVNAALRELCNLVRHTSGQCLLAEVRQAANGSGQRHAEALP